MQEAKKTKLLKKNIVGIGEVRGKLFERVKASKYVYMYRIGPDKGPGTYYEIFTRKVNKRFNTETYPSSKQFGISAFTTETEEKAIEIFKRLHKQGLSKAKKTK